ncbi:transposase [Aestuariibius sp. HNIBRBA575]|uniref:REP-associated tyrosine transposase n=1 Tax=Aestuariibius sp. HNIBRBA575 TaxID=3233343 RepID=UPI0034A0EB12
MSRSLTTSSQMPSRHKVPGGTYFFTLRLRDPHATLLVDHVDILRSAVSLARKRWAFEIDTAMILPNRMHMIWHLPDQDADYAKRWRLIKSAFSRNLPDSVTPQSEGRANAIWQRRFWEHLIQDEGDLALHRHLAITAPISAGLAKRAGDWPFSSLYRRNRSQSAQRAARSDRDHLKPGFRPVSEVILDTADLH